MSNILIALMIRDFKIMWGQKNTLLFSVGIALFLIFVIGSGVGSLVTTDLPIEYTSFLGPGIIALWVFSGAFNIGFGAIEDKDSTLKLLLVTPVPRTMLFIGMTLLGYIAMVILLFPVIAIFNLVEQISVILILPVILFLMPVILTFIALGYILALLVKKSRSSQLLTGVLSMYFIFISGLFYPIESSPLALRIAAYANPLTYCIDGLRAILTGYSSFSLLTDVVIVVASAIVTVAAAVVMLDRYINR